MEVNYASLAWQCVEPDRVEGTTHARVCLFTVVLKSSGVLALDSKRRVVVSSLCGVGQYSVCLSDALDLLAFGCIPILVCSQRTAFSSSDMAELAAITSKVSFMPPYLDDADGPVRGTRS